MLLFQERGRKRRLEGVLGLRIRRGKQRQGLLPVVMAVTIVEGIDLGFSFLFSI
jgi:hypothetical protein